MKKSISILLMLCMAVTCFIAVAEESWGDEDNGGRYDYVTGIVTTWNTDSEGNFFYEDSAGNSGALYSNGDYWHVTNDDYYDANTESSSTSGKKSSSSSSSTKSSTYVPASTQPVTAVSPYNANVKTNGGQLNVRVNPNKGATILTKLSNGYPLTVIGYTGEWLQVQANGYTGFVPSRYVSSATASVSSASSAVPYYAIVNPTNNFVNMRAQPDKSSAVVNVYYYGYQLKVVSESNGWCQVIDEATGVTGYMMKALLLYSGPVSSADEQG